MYAEAGDLMSPVKDTPPKLECYHCGEPCQEETVTLEDKAFCCTGCQMVYQLIRESGLDDFYAISETPGSSFFKKNQADFSWLDDEETIEKLLLFRQQGTARILLQIPQIHCASCIWLLEKLYILHPGVTQSRVNFNRGELSVVFDESQITLRQLVELLDKIGYRPALQLSAVDMTGVRQTNRRLIYQLGVAGFAFGNIMLFSFPEYLGLEISRDGQFAKYFGYLNLFLALPVFFYSASDYFRSALAGLRVKEINMDMPISLGILALFFQSAFEVLSQTGAGYFDSLAGLIFFMLTGKWFQQKSFDRLSFDRDYRSYFPVSASLEHGGSIPLSKLVPGHRIRVRNGELIPADSLLLSGQARIDYSFVTGESEPVSVPPGEKVFAGGRHLGGEILIQLTHTVKHSYLTQLWNEQAFQEDTQGTASYIARRVGTIFTYVIVSIAVAAFVYWSFVDSSKALFSFTSVLIIACPCAIALSIPFIMGNGVRMFSRIKAYVRHPRVIESLADANTLVWDKTGTMTHANQSTVQWVGDALSEEDKFEVSAISRQSMHPLSVALVTYLGSAPRSMAVDDFRELPGVGLEGKIGDHYWRTGRLNQSGLNSDQRTLVEIEKNGIYLGYFQLEALYREALPEVMGRLKGGMSMHVISGDQPVDQDFLGPLIGGQDRLHYRQMPSDKLQFVQNQQALGNKVMMIGDGLNDAGALRQSDVGVVLTESLNNFTPASDMILSAEAFSRLPDIISLSKRLVRHVFTAYGLALIYNITGLFFAVQGLLSPIIAAILMPASSITILIYAWLATMYESKKFNIPLNDLNHDEE